MSLGFRLQQLSFLMQPAYNTAEGYQNKDFDILDLIFMVLAHFHKLKKRKNK